MKKIGVFTSGGDAPGMNAAVRAVVRTAIYNKIEVCGIYQGYLGMIEDEIVPMRSQSVSNILQKGGTVLKSSRCLEFKTPEGRKKAFDNLSKHGIEGLVAIGGDGTFTGAHILHQEFGIPVVGIPGTIDNDIYGTDFTIGFDTAVNTALDAIDKIRDTADSHGRMFFIEVMGRDSGYIAIRAAIAGGAEAVILPEQPSSVDEIVKHLQEDIRRKKTFSIIIVAEKDSPGNSVKLAEDVKKILNYKDIRVTILGHIQRGGTPTSADRVLASRLGMGAVDGLLEDKKDVMVGIVNNQICYTPLEESISMDKPLMDDLLKTVRVLSI